MPYSLSLACSNAQYVICTCGVILCYGDLSKERDRTVHVVLTCIIESQNTLGWKGPQKSSISNTPTPLIQVHCSLFTIITHFVTLLRPEIWDVWLVLVSFLNWALSPALICLRILQHARFCIWRQLYIYYLNKYLHSEYRISHHKQNNNNNFLKAELEVVRKHCLTVLFFFSFPFCGQLLLSSKLLFLWVTVGLINNTPARPFFPGSVLACGAISPAEVPSSLNPAMQKAFSSCLLSLCGFHRSSALQLFQFSIHGMNLCVWEAARGQGAEAAARATWKCWICYYF